MIGYRKNEIQKKEEMKKKEKGEKNNDKIEYDMKNKTKINGKTHKPTSQSIGLMSQ